MKATDGRTTGYGTPPQNPNTLSAAIASSDEVLLPSNAENMQNSRPFVWLPLIAISCCLVPYTVAISSLVTYMGVCVQQLLDLPSLNESGYYTSWLASSFTVGNIISTYPWGYFADRFGRKPVMVFGLLSNGVLSVTFGLSTTFSTAMVSRFLFGLSNGTLSVARVMAVELLGPAHAVIGMTFLPGSRAIGTIIGPVIGGLLAQPAVLYPASFSSTGLFARYPFLLPNLAVALLALTCLPFVVFYLPETLDLGGGVTRGERASTGGSPAFTENGARNDKICCNSPLSARVNSETNILQHRPPHLLEQAHPCDDSKFLPRAISSTARAKPKQKTTDNSCSVDIDKDRNKEDKSPCFVDKKSKCGVAIPPAWDGGDREPPPQWKRLEKSVESGSSWFGPGGLLASWRVQSILVLQCFISAEIAGFGQIYPLWLLATNDTGGLEWSMPKIGKVLGWAGAGMMLFQFALYPVLCRTLGIIRLVRLSGAIAVLAILFTPDIQHTSWSERNSYVVGVTLAILNQSCTSVAEIAATLAATNAVPVNMRGKFSGIFAMAGGLGIVIGPSTLSSLLAWSLESTESGGGGVDYHLVFVLQAVLMAVILLVGLRCFTLESMTIPIEDRSSTSYEPFPPVDDRPPASSDAIAGGVLSRCLP